MEVSRGDGRGMHHGGNLILAVAIWRKPVRLFWLKLSVLTAPLASVRGRDARNINSICDRAGIRFVHWQSFLRMGKNYKSFP